MSQGGGRAAHTDGRRLLRRGVSSERDKLRSSGLIIEESGDRIVVAYKTAQSGLRGVATTDQQLSSGAQG
jgi:hypothetical protein